MPLLSFPPLCGGVPALPLWWWWFPHCHHSCHCCGGTLSSFMVVVVVLVPLLPSLSSWWPRPITWGCWWCPAMVGGLVSLLSSLWWCLWCRPLIVTLLVDPTHCCCSCIMCHLYLHIDANIFSYSACQFYNTHE